MAYGITKEGPPRSDGLPAWVEWRGERYDTPVYEEIQGWVYDSVCETLDGRRIEPDGCTSDGCPSWLLALSLI